jgi:hypothetical protein
VTCTPIKLRDGGSAIVCTRGRQKAPRCVKCGKPATRLCDWILERPRASLAGAIAVSKLKTCDANLCDECTTQPSPERDLCPKHTGHAQPRQPKNSGPQQELALELKPSAPGSAISSTS